MRLNEEIFTRNMTVESMFELEIGWTTEITMENVSTAYNRFLNLYNQMLENGVVPTFDIDVKKGAKDYLLKVIQAKKE